MLRSLSLLKTYFIASCTFKASVTAIFGLIGVVVLVVVVVFDVVNVVVVEVLTVALSIDRDLT